MSTNFEQQEADLVKQMDNCLNAKKAQELMIKSLEDCIATQPDKSINEQLNKTVATMKTKLETIQAEEKAVLEKLEVLQKQKKEEQDEKERVLKAKQEEERLEALKKFAEIQKLATQAGYYFVTDEQWNSLQKRLKEVESYVAENVCK